ncbi:PilZ domain-containing protein [Novosphingobium sp. 9U]|uniref:PilZ domain-containing protein n=1 Tax=Novosphingobium sp. 9U TaxID=2653158 RepID=UPI0012F2ABF5|nr:PilZ domain-containing protein [Novosphingobium sp. 9U]VWX51636.1 Pilus assembly protein PilZ [Novosphingobium sp. 9U]
MKHEPIDHGAATPARSAPRAGITLICEVRQGSRPWAPARLEDLSPGGFRIARLPGARAELPLRMRIPGMQLLSAEIRWMRDGAVGCAFAEPLHVAVFEHIVRSAD